MDKFCASHTYLARTACTIVSQDECQVTLLPHVAPVPACTGPTGVHKPRTSTGRCDACGVAVR